MAELRYRRVLLKLGGEALAGEGGFGIDPIKAQDVAAKIKRVHAMGLDVAVVVGAGNLWRGKIGIEYGMDRSTADHMGMLATVINSLALQAALERKGLPTRVMTAIEMPKVAEPYVLRRALRHLDKGRLVILSCGTGSPYFTTDTAGALRALELKADVLMKATDVDGVYTADPAIDRDATRYEKLDYQDYLLSGLSVMDWTAVSLCRANNLPIIVFNLLERGNIRKVLTGVKIGTLLGEAQNA